MNDKYVGCKVMVEGKGNVFSGKAEGIVLPNEDKSIIVVKLVSGYNIAINNDNIKSIKVLEKAKTNSLNVKTEKIIQNKSLKKVAIISMGGTIASRVDYKTGGVSPQFTSGDLISAIPEIKELAQIDAIALRNTWSENISDKDWVVLAKEIEKLASNYDGIIVTHGTDTMHYSSSMLSFMLEELSVPVVFVGAQRSSDRPSSDSAYNLIGALTFIRDTKRAGVFLAMHNSTEDNVIAIHLGTKVRKMHSSRRDAFKSINYLPVSYVTLDLAAGKVKKTELMETDLTNGVIKSKTTKISIKLSDSVSLVKFYPGMDPKIITQLSKMHDCLIIEGTGLGHVSTEVLDSIKKSKSIIFMTTQTLNGRLNMNVYTRGKELISAGVTSLDDMLPETAYVKAKYVLGKTKNKKEIIEFMTSNLKGELSDRSLFNEF